MACSDALARDGVHLSFSRARILHGRGGRPCGACGVGISCVCRCVRRSALRWAVDEGTTTTSQGDGLFRSIGQPPSSRALARAARARVRVREMFSPNEGGGVAFDLGAASGGVSARSGVNGAVPLASGLQRRASAPARGIFSVGGGDAAGADDAAASRGLPVHFMKHSGKPRASRKERVLCASTLSIALGLVGAVYVVWLLLRTNRTQGEHLQAHYAGWKARVLRCDAHSDLRARAEVRVARRRRRTTSCLSSTTSWESARELGDALLSCCGSHHCSPRTCLHTQAQGGAAPRGGRAAAQAGAAAPRL